MAYVCPVCGYDGLYDIPWDENAASDEICPCCGTHFGYDDAAGGDREHRRGLYRELRERWKAAGCPWFSGSRVPPQDWQPAEQLGRVE